MTKYVAKQKRNERFNLQKAVLGMLATGIVAWPSFDPVYATEIIRADGATADVHNVKMHKIYAGTGAGNGVGVSRFDKFDVTEGHVANLYFGRTASNTAEFKTLMNFVNNGININGTVNAIRGSGIGGHLFFLSPGGMVVGATGAINTGSLTVMTPTNAWWTNKFQNNVTQDIVNAVSAMAVPINASGTIAIQGKINATDDIRIKAGKINIGMDLTDGDKKAAQLITGKTDFTDLVNMNSTELANAGVTNLTAVRTSGSGDIELKAEVSYNENTGADTVNAIVNIAGGSQIKAAKNVTIDAQATNNVGVTVYVNDEDQVRYKVGNEDLSEDYFKAQYTNSSTHGLIGSTAELNAKVNISDTGTNITGEVVHIGAEARNVVENTFTSGSPAEMLTDWVLGILLNGLDVAYGNLTTNAEVNVGVGTEVVAKSAVDKALAVVANAKTELTLGTNIFSFEALTTANPNANFFPAVAFNLGKAKNDAKVTVAGTLTAEEGGMVVEAVAENTINSTSATGIMGVALLSDSVFNFGINIVNGHNRSKVTVEDGAVVTAEKNLSVEADAVSSINITTELSTGDNATTAFLVNTFEYDNQAEVDVNSTLTSDDGDVTVNANATYTDNTFTGNASVGKGAKARLVGNAASGSQVINKGIVQKIGSDMTDFIDLLLGPNGVDKYGNVFKKLEQYGLNGNGEAGTSLADKLHSMLGLGLSFAYMDEKNVSLVNFGNEGRIAASKGQVNVNAISKLDDVFTYLEGASRNKSQEAETSKPAVLANGALFIREIANQADVIFETADDTETQTILAKGDVKIKASAEAPYNRAKRVVNGVKDIFVGISEDEFKNSLGDLSDADKEVLWQAYDSITEKDLNEIKQMFDANGNLKPEYMDGTKSYNEIQEVVQRVSEKTDVAKFLKFLETGEFTYKDNSGVEHTINLTKKQTGIFDKIGAFFDAITPEYYANYYVGAATTGNEDSADTASKVAVAIDVGVDVADNIARIQIGKNNRMTSTEGNITINSNTDYAGVDMDGNYLPSSGGAKFSGGLVVGVHSLNNNSIVAMAEQAAITAAQNFSATAENDVLHIGLAIGLGMSKENTLSGTLQILGTDSNTLISIDDEAVLNANTISLLGDNDTTAVTVTGGLAMGNTSATGVALGYLNVDRNNLVAIADNDAVGTMTETEMEIVTEDDEEEHKTRDDEKIRLRKLLALKSGLEEEKRRALYEGSVVAAGSVSTTSLDVKAATNGHIVNTTADVGLSMSDNGDLPGKMDQFGTFLSNTKNRVDNLFGRFDSWLYGLCGGNSTWAPKPTNQTATNPQAGEQLPSFSLTTTGCAAISDIDAQTAAIADNITISFTDAETADVLNVQAADNSAIVAAGGGVAIAWKVNSAHPQETGTSVSFAGSAAVNMVNSDVGAIIKNSTINGAKTINNTAERSGALAAAATGVDVSPNTGTSAVGVAAGVSVNLAENKTIALMKDNIVNDDTYTGEDKTVINNLVTDNDLQITGAVDVNIVNGDKLTGSVGAVANWNSVKNTNRAEMDGGTYKKLGAVTDKVITDLTEINAAVCVGVAAGGGDSSAWSIEGSFLMDVFKNTAEANVKNITLMEADTLEVKAYDANLGTNEFGSYLGARGFDTTGSTYLNDAKSGADLDDVTDHGNLIITASALVTVATGSSSGNVGVGAGVVVNELDNDFTVTVDNSTITLTGVTGADILAESNTLAIGVAAGVTASSAGASKGFSGAGSFIMDFLRNDVLATVKDSIIDTAKLQINAHQKSEIYNVAGQVSVGKNAVGLDFVYNWMDTNTGAYLINTKVFNTGVETTGETDITLNAENIAKMFAVALGVEAGVGDGVVTGNGSVAVNRGHNDVEAAASSNSAEKNIVKAKNLVIHSEDDSLLVAAAGGVEVGSKVAVGGALTWNRIGDLENVDDSGEFISDGKVQVNRAALEGYTVSTTADGVVKVEAEDEADLITVSAGVGLTFGNVAVQGANANAYLDKETSAAIKNSNINKGADDTPGGKVSVLATTDNSLTTTAAVFALGTTVAVGAGLAENTISTDTSAILAGGQYALKDLLIKADSNDRLLNVAVGTAALSTVAVGGSLVFNEIDNDTIAVLGKDSSTSAADVTEVEADENVGVVAESKEDIQNHSGQLEVSKLVGVGLALSSNEIDGGTKAILQNAKVTAKGNGNALEVRDSKEKDGDGKWSGKGVVVNADALHSITNDTFSGGLSLSVGDTAVAIGLDGVTGIDRIGGITQAKVYAANINEAAVDSALNNQNLSVRATDKVDTTAVISNAVVSIAAGVGVSGSLGVGVSKDVEERQVEAVIEGTDDRKNVNAKSITLYAGSLADLNVVNTAVSLAGSVISGTVTTGVCYTDLKETTKATMKNVVSYNDGLNILAHHEDNVDIVGTGLTLGINPSIYSGGAAVGVHVDSENNTATTEALLDSSTIHHYTDNTAEDSIKAESVSDVLTQDANLTAEIGVFSASVGVMVQDNDLRETVKTTVSNSTIGTDQKRAKNITVASDNKVTTHFYNENVSGALIAGIGVGVGLNTVDTVTLTNITNSTLYSRNDIKADAKDNISLNGTMVQATVGALSVGVSTLHNYVNTTTVNTSSETAVWDTVKIEQSADNTGDGEYNAAKIDALAKQAVDDGNTILEKINTDSQVEKGSITDGTKTARTTYEVELPNSGTKVNLAGANLYANGNITTTAQSTVNSDTDLGAGSLGAVNIAVEVNKQHVKGDVGVNVTGGTMNANNNITLNALMDGVLKSQVVKAALSGVAVLVTHSDVIKDKGGTTITLDSAKLTTNKDINLLSEDTRTIEHKATTVTSSGIEGSGYDITSKDKSVSKIALQNTAELSAKNINIENYAKPSVATEIDAVSVSVTGGSGVIVESKSENQALMTVADGVKLLGTTVTLANGIDVQKNKYTLDTDVTGVFVSGIAVPVNKSRTYSDIKAETTVGAIALRPGRDSNLIINTFDATNVHNDVRGVNVGALIAVGSNYAQSDLKSTVSTTINAGTTGINARSLTIKTEGHDTLDIVANGDGGGVIDISPVAAQVESKITGNTTTTLTGKFYIIDALNVGSMLTDDLSCLADSLHATVVGGGGTQVSNEINVNTLTEVKNANLTVGGKTTINAIGKVNLNKIDQTLPEDERFEPYILECSGIGGLGNYSGKADSKVHFNNKVNFVNSTLHGYKSIVLGAYAEGDIHVSDSTLSGGLLDETTTILLNEVKTDDEVAISDSQIYTDNEGQDISVVAQDKLTGSSKGYAEMTAAVMGFPQTEVTNTMERKNIINITGNSKLHSLRDINLYANRDERGEDGLMEWQLRSVLFCGSLIPSGAETYLTNSMNQLNQITVDTDAVTESIRHTNIYAAAGRESIVQEKGEYKQSLITSDEAETEYVSTTAGGIDAYVSRNNFVQVLGKVTAGTTNKITINIGTPAEAIVVRDEIYKGLVGDANDPKPVYTYAEKANFISFGDTEEEQKAAELAGLTADDFTVDWMDYSKVLQDRLKELIKLQTEYKKDGTSDISTYMQLDAEINRVRYLIDTLELGGSFVTQIDYIELPDLVASGGNIVVDTGTLYGSGNMTAKGDPVITVNNYTNLMLVTNKITVEDPGGEFVYNGNRINQETLPERKAEVEKINVTKELTIPNIDAALGTEATIRVTNYFNTFNYVGGDMPLYDEDGNPTGDTEAIEGGNFSPRADIEVNGNITCLKGNVGIENKHHDITIEGKNVSDNVVVSGSVVSIVAPNGSVTQGYTDGIVNIGGDVRQQYELLYDAAVIALKDKQTGAYIGYDLLHRPEEEDGDRALEDAVRGGWIAGGQVYINASDININGNIQSGFPKYVLELNDDNKTAIDSITTNWKNNGSRPLTDSQVVNSGATYRIKEGGVVWSSAEGCFIYQMESYYRPDTQTIIVPSVNADGGRIYLTGRISSTGDGRIICLDGAYNVGVTNSLNYDLQLGELQVHETKGQIVMADSGMGRRITYTTDGVLWEDCVYDSVTGQYKYVKNTGKSSSTGSKGYTYNPEEGLNYCWVTGYELVKFKRYKHEEMAHWWGWDDYDDDGADKILDEWEKIEEPYEIKDAGEDPVPRPDGAYITTGGNRTRRLVITKRTFDFVVDHTYLLDETKAEHTLEGTDEWTTGVYGCHKHIRYYWKDTMGSYQSDTAMVKADNPVSIKFVGVDAKDAKVVVENTGNRDVILTGNVGNTQLYSDNTEKGTVRITSGGSIVQNSGSIFGADIELKAAQSIQDVAVVSGKSINLDAITTGKGQVSATVKAANGLAGSDVSVQLGNYGGANASSASLMADGNIYQRTKGYYDNNVLVQGSRIDLTSNYGQIGSASKSIAIKAGQQANATDTLSASANVRAYGDIYLTQTAGDLRVGNIWSDNGNLTIEVTNGGMVDALPYVERTGRDENDLVREWVQLGLIDDGSERARAAIAGKTADLQKFRADYQKRIDEETDPVKKAELQEQLSKIPEQYRVWNKDQLLYAIQDSVINPEAGVRPSSGDKNPNLYGKNITLKVKNNAGLDDPNLQVIDLRTLGDKNPDGSLVHLDELKALSQADASTVIWDEINGKATIEKKLAIGLNQRDGGVLTVTNISGVAVADNIYVEGREFNADTGITNPNNNLTVADLLATNDVRVTSLGALLQRPGAQIKGRNLLLSAGGADSPQAFDLGSADNYLRVNLTGSMTALATGNIYVIADGNLVIASASAGKQGVTDSGKIFFKAAGDITGLYVADQGLQGYIRSETDKDISLIAGGSIGDWSDVNKTVRIKNGTEGELSLQAADEIVVEGVSTADASEELAPDGKYLQTAAGVLNIAVLESGAKKARITVNGGVGFKDDSVNFGLDDGSELDIYGAGLLSVNGSITADTVMLSGATGVQLLGGQITGNNVTLQTGYVPALTYGTAADVAADAIANADVTNNNTVGIKAVNLAAKANRDITLGGGGIFVDKADLDAQGNVNLAVQSVSGLTFNGKVAKATNVSVHNSQDTEGESCVGGTVNISFNDSDTNKALELNDVGALGVINITSMTKLENLADSAVYSENGPVYIDAQGYIRNLGTIKSENGYLLLTAGGSIQNAGNIDSGSESVFLISEDKITNRVPTGMANKTLKEIRDEGQGTFSDRRRYITAGKHVVMCAEDGLDNEAIIFAGLKQSGGNVILDDFELFNRDGLLDDTIKNTIIDKLTSDGKYDAVSAIESKGDVKNKGMVAALKGTVEETGLVYMDSQGSTINQGDDACIYSVDGEVHIDATGDLTNNKDIYVVNTKTDGTSCDVSLLATGNIYNTGDIHVQGKGAVLLDADSMDQDGLDLDNMTAEQIAGHLKTSTIAGHTFKGVYNTGDIYASEGDVTFKSMYGGDIYNEDTLTSASLTYSNGNISMTSPLGRITNTKALYATGNIDIESYSHIYNLPALNGTEPTEVEGQSIMRGLTSENGHISLKSNNGAIVNAGTITTMNGDIILEAHGYLDNYKRLTDKNNDGKINLADYELSKDAEGNVVLDQVLVGIYNHVGSDYTANHGDITITSDYTIDASGSFVATKTDDESAGGNITVKTIGDSSGQNGDIYHYGHEGTIIIQNGEPQITEVYEFGDLMPYEMVKAEGEIKYEARNKAFLMTDMIATDNINMTFDEGAAIAEEITCIEGSVTIETKGQSSDGNLTVSAKISAGGGVSLISAGDLLFDATSGAAAIDAKDDIVFNAEENVIINDASHIKTTEGSINVLSENKAVTVEGNLTAATDMVVDAKEEVKLNGNVVSQNADIVIGSADKKVTVTGNIKAAEKITMDAKTGITVKGEISATDGDVRLDTAGGVVKIEGQIQAKGQDRGVEILSGDFDSGSSGIVVKGTVEAGGFVRLYTKGDTDEGRAGKYEDRNPSDYTRNNNNRQVNPMAELEEGIYVTGDIITDGDIDIATYGDDVVVENLTADKMAAVGTSGGKITINGTIKGNDVALYSEKETAAINFGKIDVTEKLILAGNEFNLDMSNIQTDSDLFDLYVYGAIGEDGTVNPTGSIKIDYRNIPGGEKKEVEIRQMNVVNAEIYTDGALTIDNLSVANRAEINVMGTKTNVYGTMQAADANAQFIYYDPGKGATALDLSHVYFGYDSASKQAHVDALSRDPSIFEKPAYNPDNCPVCAEETYTTGVTGTVPGTSIGGTSDNKGHKFEQSSVTKQRFAGVLLLDNFGYKAYAQRFSAGDLMTHLEDIKAIVQHDNYFNVGLDFFDRFNIIDIPDVTVNSITLNNTFRDSGIIVVREDRKEDEYDF